MDDIGTVIWRRRLIKMRMLLMMLMGLYVASSIESAVVPIIANLIRNDASRNVHRLLRRNVLDRRRSMRMLQRVRRMYDALLLLLLLLLLLGAFLFRPYALPFGIQAVMLVRRDWPVRFMRVTGLVVFTFTRIVVLMIRSELDLHRPLFRSDIDCTTAFVVDIGWMLLINWWPDFAFRN